MVAATSSLAFAYNQAQSLYAQLSPQGSTLGLQQQTQAAVVQQNANGDVFGAAVEVDISVSIQNGAVQNGTTASSPASSSSSSQPASSADSTDGSAETPGQKALATVEASNAQARAFPKQEAAEKLKHALDELKILKLIGGPKGVQLAGKIAKEVESAVKEYAGAEQNQLQAGDITSIPDPSTDPFFQVATAVLGEVGKYLKKNAPAVETSPNPKEREIAKKAEKAYGDAVSEIQSAESGIQSANANASGGSGSSGAGGSESSVTITETITEVAFSEAAGQDSGDTTGDTADDSSTPTPTTAAPTPTVTATPVATTAAA